MVISARLNYSSSGKIGVARTSAVSPTPMRRIEFNKRLNDIIDRRIRIAPQSIIRAAYGFDKFGIRIWSCSDYDLVAIGRTPYLRQCDAYFDSYKNPFPGMIDKRRFGPAHVAVIEKSRINIIENCRFDGLQAVIFGADCGIMLKDIEINDSALGLSLKIDLAFAISFGDRINQHNSHRELEILLTRSLS